MCTDGKKKECRCLTRVTGRNERRREDQLVARYPFNDIHGRRPREDAVELAVPWQGIAKTHRAVGVMRS